jgi:hypothetical protein
MNTGENADSKQSQNANPQQSVQANNGLSLVGVFALNWLCMLHSKSNLQIHHYVLFHDWIEHLAQIIANIKRSRVSQRPYLQCQTFLVQYETLYGTGADISCINEDFLRKILIQQRPPRSMEHSSWNIKTAGGQALNVRGKYEIYIEVMRKKV